MDKKLQEFALRARELKDSLDTEEATKTALIMPFFSLLEYDVFNPLEFIPEFTCDVGIKKGEKVDYAVKKDDKIIMVVEAKKVGYDLNKVDNQLTRYFHATEAQIAIMTDGVKYKFFSDLDKENVMDKDAFFEFDLENLLPQHISDIEKFKKDNFEIKDILSLAKNMRTIDLLKERISYEMSDPSWDLVKLLINDIYPGVKTKQIIDEYSLLIKKSFNQLINDKVATKINNALLGIEDEEEEENKKLVETTEQEIQFFQIVKSLLVGEVDINRVYYKDTQSYISIVLDDKVTKWIVRAQWRISKNDIRLDFNDDKVIYIKSLNELFDYKEEIIECAKSVV